MKRVGREVPTSRSSSVPMVFPKAAPAGKHHPASQGRLTQSVGAREASRAGPILDLPTALGSGVAGVPDGRAGHRRLPDGVT
jgi:hypothetical protein